MEGIVLQLSNDDADIREQGSAKLTEACNILKTTLHLAPAVTDDLKTDDAFHDAMSQVIFSIHTLTEFDKDRSAKVLDLLDRLCRNTPEATSPHVVLLVTTCISIAENELLDVLLRVKALRVIKSLVDAKSTTVRNNELVVPIIDMIYSVMSEPVDNELGDFYLKALTNYDTPITCAMQILHLLSKRLASQELVAEVLQRTELVFEEPDIHVKRGRYLGLAVIIEPCQEVIEEDLLKYVRPSYTDSRPIIRNVVQLTIARISGCLGIEDLYKDELLPVYIGYLDSCCTEIKQGKDVSTMDTLFDILDSFSLYFGRKMKPYLSRLMDYVFGILESDISNHTKTIAIKSFVYVPDGTFEIILTYYPRLISILKSWVAEKPTKETAELQASTFALLASIGWSFEKKDILPAIEYFSNAGVQAVKSSRDPALKSAVYTYFFRTSSDSPALIVEALSQSFDIIIRSVQMAEPAENPENEDNIRYRELVIEEDITLEYQVDNIYLEEKTTAIKALGELCEELEKLFLPFLEESHRKVMNTLNYPKAIVREASLDALTKFFEVSSQLEINESNRQMLLNSTEVLVPFLRDLIYKTNDINLLGSAAHTYSRVLKFLESELPILETIKDTTAKCIIDILSGNIRAQKLREALTDEVDFTKHAGGSMLRYYFRSGISAEYLVMIFEQILPLLIQYADGKVFKHESKASGFWYIASCFRGLGSRVSKFASKLISLFIQTLAESCCDFAACHALAEITRHGGSDINPYYPDIQNALLAALQNSEADSIKDDYVIALGSLIWTNYSNLNVEEVFPIFVSSLPLQQHVPRYKAVLGGILTLVRDHHVVLNGHIKPLMNIAVKILQTGGPIMYDKYEEVSLMATEFLRIVRQDYAHLWAERRTFLTPEEVSFVENLNFAVSKDPAVLL